MPKGLIGKYIYDVMVRLYQEGKISKVGSKEFIEYFNKSEPKEISINDAMLSTYLNQGVRPLSIKMEKIESLDPLNK